MAEETKVTETLTQAQAAEEAAVETVQTMEEPAAEKAETEAVQAPEVPAAEAEAAPEAPVESMGGLRGGAECFSQTDS